MSWSASQLVNFSPATDAPRAVHTLAFELRARDEGEITSRVLHQLPRVVAVTLGYTRARWLDCRVTFVPSANLFGRSVVVCCAFGPDNLAPVDVTELNERATCSFNSSGSSQTLPAIMTFPLSFEDAGTSELVRPPPVELQRSSFSISFDLAGDSDLVDLGPEEPVFSVFVAGHISVGGTQ